MDTGSVTGNFQKHRFAFKNFDGLDLTATLVFKNTTESVDYDAKSFLTISPEKIQVNYGLFVTASESCQSVEAGLNDNTLTLSCICNNPSAKLCRHQARVLYNLVMRDELRIFFDRKLRHERFRKFAADYGLENEEDLDAFFGLEYNNKKIVIKPGLPGLLPVTNESLTSFEEQLLPETKPSFPQSLSVPEDSVTCIVLRQHKYYRHLLIDLYQAPTTKEGKIKNPLKPVNLPGLIWKALNQDQFKFYTAIRRFQDKTDFRKSAADIENLKMIIRNPLGFSFFYHDSEVSDNINSASIHPVGLQLSGSKVSLHIDKKGEFYTVSGHLDIRGQQYNPGDLTLAFTYFIFSGGTLYLIDNFNILGIIGFFKNRSGSLLIHHSKFRIFKSRILSKLEDQIRISYSYIEEATQEQIEKNGFNNLPEKMIYLSGSGSYVELDPVMKYGDAEVSILTKRLVSAIDEKGNEFIVKRNAGAETEFAALLTRQHPHFAEQLEEGALSFYLHKERFLDEDWFLNAFDEWGRAGITILGFNEIQGNKLNPDKVKITIHVTSGINWFNTEINARYGKNKASLKQIYRSVRNKSRFVKLDDGTIGILPSEWIEKFSEFFQAGEIVDDTLRTAKINYSVIARLYNEDLLDEEVKNELRAYQSKLSDFDSIKEVEVPEGLNGTLRAYQKQGLSWLNFLDDFNFGGCLADDMGLGKSIQIIAFILLQRAKAGKNTNLLVVPTSLIVNWQEEIAKFAPSVKIHTIYGPDRVKNIGKFDHYEVILTSYGTLLSDISFLREYEFNYIFLDESQNIKNPESQRYKAVRLLKSRNKIAISGTPIENNTFDLYGQLSFACPGLLGTKQHFRDIYSTPVDKFKNHKRALELQKKISPFILRRTKQQVATELPEKTEMIIYCGMLPPQRKIYAAYEKELREFISATTNEEIPKKSMYVLRGLTRLRQICNSPVLLEDQSLYADTSAKIEALIEQIESKSVQHKILIFSQFVSMLNLIKKELVSRGMSFKYLTGATKNRNTEVKNFQEDETVRIFLISLKAGGTGLNLTAADYVYIVDPWWNPAVENQAIDRCFRIGQKKNVMAVRLICPDTVEEKILKLQESKKDLTEGLIKPDTSVLKSLTKSDLMGLLES